MDNSEKVIKKYKLRGIEAILLDFDGTLIPSEMVFFKTWQKVFLDKFSCHFTKEEYVKYELESDSQLINYLFECEKLSKNFDKQILMESVYEEYNTSFKTMVKQTDFYKYLEHIKKWVKHDIKVSIVSTSKRNYIDIFFDKYKDYKELFIDILCREDVLRLKPNPMVYFLAARRIEVDIPNCLIIEDSPKGVLGALATGMKVVRVIENTIVMNDAESNRIPTLNSIMDIEP